MGSTALIYPCDEKATVQDFLVRERQVKEAERDRIKANLQRHNIETFQGVGSFVDPHTVRVCHGDGTQTDLTGEYVLIATGSSPSQPPMFPFEHERVWDSDEILNLAFMPQSLAVVGGGVIGSEYACLFAALGVSVYLIDGRDTLLGFLDSDISNTLKNNMERLGIEFIMPDRVAACEANDHCATLELTSGRRMEVDAVLVAAGRVSNVEQLNLGAAGIEEGKRGLIDVDSRYRTSVQHIYAAGDVIGFPL